MTVIDPGQFRLLTFDCYGTLIDWEQGIAAALAAVVRSHVIETDPETLLRHFAAVEHGVQSGPFLSYRDVLRRTLEGVGERLSFTPTPEEKDAFAASVGDWPAFPDSSAALRRLKAKYRLAIVSNVDDDLFERSAERLGVDFDWVVTAEQVGSYKPAPPHFHEILSRFGEPKEQVLHVAQSLFHDVAPARALGITTLWINRRGGRSGSGASPPADAQPHAEVPDMASAADLLLGS